ncbi:response regulator [Roseivirga pacifica]|uniref:response regulator n=1 Tax=Roseivirga pacifica TaxID=1267423 RepID=UPI00227CFAAB|nr:response regulator [Roseivirga pacifica]
MRDQNNLSARILIVDDNPLCIKILSRLCSKWGFETVTANNSQQALDALSTTSIDLVVSDIYIPGMDGLLLSKKIKEMSPSTPLILTSGFEAQEIESKNVAKRPFIQKPYIPSEMHELIVNQLHGKVRKSA